MTSQNIPQILFSLATNLKLVVGGQEAKGNVLVPKLTELASLNSSHEGGLSASGEGTRPWKTPVSFESASTR